MDTEYEGGMCPPAGVMKRVTDYSSRRDFSFARVL